MRISKQIEQKVQSLPEGTILFSDDFAGEYSYEAARKTLQRLNNNKKITRLAHGIYYIQKEDELLGLIKPSAEKIAEAIAERDKARILPTGAYALYKLGLSTQIPLNVVYLTDGSARQINVGKQRITFRKTSPKNLAVKHRLTSLIIQGLKNLGEGNIDPSQLSALKEIISRSNEASQIRKTIIYAPVWIQKIITGMLEELESE